MLMFQKALEEEAKRQLPTGKGLWQQLEENGYKAQYQSLSVDMIKETFGKYFGKKRIRRKMKKHGKTI